VSLSRALRPKDCRSCGAPFHPRDSMQHHCSPRCALEYYRAKLAPIERAREKTRKQRRGAQRTKAQWTAMVQTEFNRFVRLRDDGLPCISCGAPEAEVERDQAWKFGGAWDCGHFKSVGAHPELRFDEDNAHRQCKQCNSGSRTAGADHICAAYRVNLIQRIGARRLARLEGHHDPARYDVSALRDMLETYRRRVREMLAGKDQ